MEKFRFRVPDDGHDSGPLIRWSKVEPGFEIEGVWCGEKPSLYGTLGQIQTPDGTVAAFSIPTDLGRRLRKVREGAEILIVFLERQSLRNGNTFLKFDVRLAVEADLLPDVVADVQESEEVPY